MLRNTCVSALMPPDCPKVCTVWVGGAWLLQMSYVNNHMAENHKTDDFKCMNFVKRSFVGFIKLC